MSAFSDHFVACSLRRVRVSLTESVVVVVSLSTLASSLSRLFSLASEVGLSLSPKAFSDILLFYFEVKKTNCCVFFYCYFC